MSCSLPKNKDEDPEEVGAAQEAVSSFQNGGTSGEPEDYVWMLEPPGQSIPSCILVFTGGAALGNTEGIVAEDFEGELIGQPPDVQVHPTARFE